jgi:hypothetical protein
LKLIYQQNEAFKAVKDSEAAKVKKKCCVTHDTVVFLRVTIHRISMADRTAWFENILSFCGVVW